MTPPKETTIIQPALLPCPFCGAPDPATGHSFVGYWYGEVTCCDCHGEITATGNNATEATQNAITAWNTRVQPAPVEQDVERVARAIMLAQNCGLMRNGQRVFCDHCDCMDAARAALSTLTPARAEGFRAGVEAAAKLCETYDEWCGGWGLDRNLNAATEGAKECAKAIRALGSNDHG